MSGPLDGRRLAGISFAGAALLMKEPSADLSHAIWTERDGMNVSPRLWFGDIFFLFFLNPPLALWRCVSRRSNAGTLVMSHQGGFCMSASGNENASGVLLCHYLWGLCLLFWVDTLSSVTWLYLGALFIQNVMGCRIQCNTSEHLKHISCFNW